MLIGPVWLVALLLLERKAEVAVLGLEALEVRAYSLGVQSAVNSTSVTVVI